MFEAQDAIRCGAEEIDMVLPIGRLKAGDNDFVLRDISAVVSACRATVGKHIACKVILETCLLTQNEKVQAAELCVLAGADFVKTSTGFSSGGATVDDVRLLDSVAGVHGLGVKASGGIRSREDAETMIAAGATRIGASKGVRICEGEASGGTGAETGPATGKESAGGRLIY